MPVSPYISPNTYATRPYSRGNTSYAQTSTVTSSYGTSKYYGDPTSTTSITSGYKAGGYGKSKLPIPEDSTYDHALSKIGQYTSPLSSKPPPYMVGRYKSSDNIPESQTLLELKLKKSNSNSALLKGNTANILKSFNNVGDKSPTSNFPPRPKYSDRPEERSYTRNGGPSVFASHYLAKINKGREFRPKEIDTRDINTTIKPKVAPGFASNSDDENYGAITRNSRHVVRLTIKREEPDDPFVVKDKTLKTIAQRLIEKYTEKEKKPDPYEYVPRKRLYEEKKEKAGKVDAVGTSTPSPIVTSSIASDTTANNASKDSNVSATFRKKSLADIRAAMSQQNSFDEEEDVASRLLRATSMAAKKKELENPEEVKDAIIAAVLHPDVDIESDEEMKELVQGSNGKCNALGKRTDIKIDGETSDCHSDEGKNIVGQLKRYVKKQVSTKCQSKKKSSERKSSRTSSKKSKKERKKSESQLDDNSRDTNMTEEEGKPATKSSSRKDSVKEENSLLSSDLIFGSGKKLKKSKKKSRKSKEAATDASEGAIPLGKSENKSGSSLLSANLVFNNLTSDEENDMRPKTPVTTEKENEATKMKEQAKEDTKMEEEEEDRKGKEKKKEPMINNKEANTSEIESSKEKKEKVVSKIPKIKKKSKKTAVADAEESTEVLPKIKVSPVGSPSETPLKGPPEVKEKVTDFKEARDSDTSSGINKKISSKTSRTGNSTQTSDHGLESTSSAESKKSIHGKEIKSARSEKSSGDAKREKVSEEKSISDPSAEFKTSTKLKEKDWALGNRDENSLTSDKSPENKTVVDVHGSLEITEEKSVDKTKEKSCKNEKGISEGESEGNKEKTRSVSEISSSNKIIDSLKEKVVPESKEIKKEATPRELPEAASAQKEDSQLKASEQKKIEINSSKENLTNEVKVSNAQTEDKTIVEKVAMKEETEGKNKTVEIEDIKESKSEEAATDAITGKKAIKRPRQVGPPPPQDNSLGTADLLNARKILKRPVKKIGVQPAPEETQTQPPTPEEANKKVWKRPIPQLVPPKEGDQFLQARNILKKPVKPKIGEKDDKAAGILPEMKVIKFKKVGAAAAAAAAKEGGEKGAPKQRSRSPSSSDEEGEDGAKKAGRPRRPLKPRPAGDKKTPSPPGSPVKKTASPSGSPTEKTSTHKSPSSTTTLEGSGKSPSQSKESSGSYGQDPKLSACQSADSGYGSSPSTPQPTQNAADAKDEEICTVCGTNCHKKCEKQMANLCGVNQKLLAEALSSVKKAGSADGTSRTLGSPTKSSSVSGSESETTTEEESETDTDTDYFGLPEIRPPLQSRPKFKKYNIDDFIFVKVLGKGSYGKVMLAQQKGSENYFAVKCLKKDVVLEDNDIECTLIERKVLSLGTKHPYLCHLFCTFQTPSHLFFVMEYLTGGDLMFHIQHCGRFDEYRACFYAAEITSGLKFLHSKGIIYRDLKLDNILLDYQGHIRIADFGMCKLQVYLDRYADTFCGTPDYMAPEVIKGQHYNQCVDWWSFGVLLYEMLTGKSPFKGCDEDHLFWLICNDEPFYPKFLTNEATDILKGLLDKDSTRRLGIPFSPYGEILDHAFFKYIDWGKIERKEVETPYKPRLRHILDVQYFDKLFTKRHAALTPLDESILATMDQTAFTDFSYTNPNITD